MEKKLEVLFSEDVRAAVLTGKDDSFIAGADIKEMKKMDPEEARYFSSKGQRVFDRLRNAPFPVIGAINGHAIGGGLELALRCDFLIASDEAFFALPEVELGLIPGLGGTYDLAEAVGYARAKELIFTGKRIDADSAEEWGLVNRVVPDEDLMEETRSTARRIVDKSPTAVKKAKLTMALDLERQREKALRVESDRFGECFKEEDSSEGMEAFLENREPDF